MHSGIAAATAASPPIDISYIGICACIHSSSSCDHTHIFTRARAYLKHIANECQQTIARQTERQSPTTNYTRCRQRRHADTGRPAASDANERFMCGPLLCMQQLQCSGTSNLMCLNIINIQTHGYVKPMSHNGGGGSSTPTPALLIPYGSMKWNDIDETVVGRKGAHSTAHGHLVIDILYNMLAY